MSVVQARFTRKAIEERFNGLFDMSDQRRLRADKIHQAFLSRGLAALAIQIEHACSDALASEAVFDGQDDHGLDAVAVDTRTAQPRIFLVQAKWSDKAQGSFGETEVHKMLYGLDLILDLRFQEFNHRFQRHVPSLENAFERVTPKIILILALMRTEPINSGVRTLLEEKISQYNQVEEMVEYKILDLRDFHRAILGDAAAPKINAKVRLEGFGQETSPYKAMYGTMTAPDIADLYGEHRRGLFARNIRDALDVTDVNVKIRNTLIDKPEHFWYFSNGITILCDSIKPFRTAIPGRVGEFQLTGASVVNGAQTVSAIHKAYSADPETAQLGRVLVRLISLEDCPPGFGDQVTTSTNTQNPIEDRDFKSLDPIQVDLRDQFASELSLSYVIKRGESLPEPAHGCSITEAAEALAATHSNAEYAALAKRDISSVWQDDAYQGLFGSMPDARRVWRCVQLLRKVRETLSELREGLLWRANAMATYGDLLIAHVIFRQLDTDDIQHPSKDWDAQLGRVPSLVEDALVWALNAIDAEYGAKSHIVAAVRNTERIQRIARTAIKGIVTGHPTPELNADYQVSTAERRSRQVHAVKTLVRAKRIPDGTVLEFRPVSRPERREMTDWLAEDPKRSLAIWRNSDKEQLQWMADMQWYSPSRLVSRMRFLASGVDQAVQGTLHWHVPAEGSLKSLAERTREEQDIAIDHELEELDGFQAP